MTVFVTSVCLGVPIMLVMLVETVARLAVPLRAIKCQWFFEEPVFSSVPDHDFGESTSPITNRECMTTQDVVVL